MPISELPCPRRRRRARFAPLALVGITLLLSSCAALQQALAPEPEPAPRAGPAPAPTRASGMLRLEDYLAYARLLSQVQPAEQKKVYQQAISAHQKSPTPHRKLRYALTLEVLASPYSDPRKALHLFKELAAATPPLPRELWLLVNMEVHTLQQRLELTDRVAILTKALHDADAKIDALTDIEQSLERPTGGQDATP